jgi:NodT family efflux transporter outer membrane factor (OMF) lipoprotein
MRSQSQNLDLLTAYERIVEARANLRLVGGQLLPNADSFSGYQFTKRSQNASPFVAQNGNSFNLFTRGLDASWEIDLFGRIKRTIESAEAELGFQEFEQESVRQSLNADIASSYLSIRLLQAQVSETEESLAVQSETAKLVAERSKAGVSTELDRRQTESFLNRSKALRSELKVELELEHNRLSLLLGESPSQQLRDFIGVQSVPSIPAVPLVGIPADLLQRRPDVWRDRMAVAAASAKIGIAESDLHPQLSLLGTISVRAKSPSQLFQSDSLAFSVGPSFRWNILHFGRIFDNIEVHQARLNQAALKYQSTALNAVREVEDSLVQHAGFVEQLNLYEQAVVADIKSVELSLERYKAGKANFQRVLDSQQQLLQDRQKLNSAQALAIEQLVRLFKSLGGNWDCNQSNIDIATEQEVIAPQMEQQQQPEDSLAFSSNEDETDYPALAYPGFQEMPNSQAKMTSLDDDESSFQFIEFGVETPLQKSSGQMNKGYPLFSEKY